LININRAILAAAKLQTTDLSCRRGDTVYTSGAPAHFVYVVKKGAVIAADAFPDEITYNDLQRRMVCTVCDHRGADVRTAWHER
jgi:hypothetical protein